MDFTPEILIREKIDAKHIVRARDIFTVHRDSIPREKQDPIAKELAELFNQAEALHSQAIAAENQGRGDEALSFFEAVYEIMEDYPKIEENLERVRSAEALRRVVQKRMERNDQIQEPEPPKGFPIWAIVATTVVLLLAISFLFVGNKEKPVVAREDVTVNPLVTTTTQQSTETTAPLAATETTAPSETNTLVATAPGSNPTTPSDDQEIELQPLTVNLSSDSKNTLTLDNRGGLLTDTPTDPVLADEITDQVDIPTSLKDHLYEVQPGDSLSNIAYRLFCNEIAREQLFQLNRDQVNYANEIEVGMLLRIKGDGVTIENRCKNKTENTN